MQIHIKLSADELRLPIAYQYLVQGMIYHALAAAPQYQRFLHNEGYAEDGKRFKCFTFSRLNGKFQIGEGRIAFSGNCDLEIRSCDPYLIQQLLYGFAEGTTHRLGSNRVTVTGCMLADRHIISDSVEIGMLSPLTVYRTTEDGHTEYAAPNEMCFYDLVQDNAEQKWNSLMPMPLRELLHIEPIAVTLRDKVVTTYKGTYITGWMGAYRLTGPQQLLDLLYQIGLGAKNSQGFGMFEVL